MKRCIFLKVCGFALQYFVDGGVVKEENIYVMLLLDLRQSSVIMIEFQLTIYRVFLRVRYDPERAHLNELAKAMKNHHKIIKFSYLENVKTRLCQVPWSKFHFLRFISRKSIKSDLTLMRGNLKV